MIIQNANVLSGDRFKPGDLYIEGDRFAAAASGETLDAAGMYAIPGLVDIHLHGCMGFDFCDGSRQATTAIAKYQAQSGITAFCPATMTLPEERLVAICSEAAAYAQNALAPGEALLAGITMEGPFFSAAKKGAQNERYLRAPGYALYSSMQQASGGMLRVACVAPELPDAMEYIRCVSADGCKVSLAHTTADYDTAIEAAKAGASHVTHLYNAMPPFAHRAPGIVGAAFDSGMTVELVCDGFHLHPSVVRATLAMFGSEHVVLISDSMMATGLGNGTYELGGQAVFVNNKRALLQDGTLAGSSCNLMDCLRTAVSFGIPLAVAAKMASTNPAKVIGCFDEMGSIEPGKLANLVLLDTALNVTAVFIRGGQVK